MAERKSNSKAIVRSGSGCCHGRGGMIRGDGFNDREDAAEVILGHEEAGSATTEEGTDEWAV